MITGELKAKIDKLWVEFWTGGITNPLTVIEQITFLIYARLLDMNEISDEKRSERTGEPFHRRFRDDQQHIRWQNLRHVESADRLMKLVRDELFPFFTTTSGARSSFAEFMKDAQLMIQKPGLLRKAVEMVNELPLNQGDIKGDLYEYLLGKLTTAGINGQFRTPRQIIRTIVEMMDPVATDRICDPACGTAGFLATTYEFLLEKYSSQNGVIREPFVDENGIEKEQVIFLGDLLAEHRQHVDNHMFHGFDFDATMLRIAAMNLVMHGVAEPDVHYQDTLSRGFSERFPEAANEGFDLVLANPPFKGTLDDEDIDAEILRTVESKKTELLFVGLILRMLKVGGRAAVIVPDGVLFGSSRAHQQLRKTLVEDNQLEAVVSLPSGVFKPYAGVSTAIVVFTKAGQTDHVWFYDLKNDGFSLDDKRTPIEENDLPDLVGQWKDYASNTGSSGSLGRWRDKTSKAFLVEKCDIATNKYDLSINRYKEVVYEAVEYDPPEVILDQLEALEAEIQSDLKALRGML